MTTPTSIPPATAQTNTPTACPQLSAIPIAAASASL